MQEYDIIIIGGGPAGLTAALYARRAGKTVLLLEKATFGGQATFSPKIENYPGIAAISGNDLADKLIEQVLALGAEVELEEVVGLHTEGDEKIVISEYNKYRAKSVIIAAGAKHRRLGLPGEDNLVGEGISYCATCDGMFFRGKKVFYLSELEEGEKEANFLADICAEVYYLPRYKGEYTALDPRITVVSGRPLRFHGEDKLTAVETSAGQYEVEGVFVERASLPLDRLMPGLTLENGFIKVDRQQQTDVPGIFAAGDCTGKPWQIANAVGEGLVAALSAVDYLATGKG